MRIAFGFMIVFMASAALNTYQYTTQRNERQTRLEANLQRPMPNIAGKSLDATLKEVSYGDQLKHPRGIATGDLEALLNAKMRGERDDVIFLDIRESAETEMGTLPGAQIVRFPDIAKAKLDLAGKTPILFCHNGNRGFETCEALAKLGIDCRFLVGGLGEMAGRRPLAHRTEGPHAGRSSCRPDLPQPKRAARHAGRARPDRQ